MRTAAAPPSPPNPNPSDLEKISKGLSIPDKFFQDRLHVELESYIVFENILFRAEKFIRPILFYLCSTFLVSGFFNESEISRKLFMIAMPLTTIFFVFYGYTKKTFFNFYLVSNEINSTNSEDKKLWILADYFFKLFLSQAFIQSSDSLKKKYCKKLLATYPKCDLTDLKNALNTLINHAPKENTQFQCPCCSKNVSQQVIKILRGYVEKYVPSETLQPEFVPHRQIPMMG